MGCLIVAIVWIGIYPQPVIKTAQPTVNSLEQNSNNMTFVNDTGPTNKTTLKNGDEIMTMARKTSTFFLSLNKKGGGK
ncbi:MAG: hypothetical protein HBSAPP04_27480 [Ignavibacteriaceae bacterium]|nr:MAG: hypothetical protein HBSAPP04_27480 [Ignavibacteriaceae bacterium]